MSWNVSLTYSIVQSKTQTGKPVKKPNETTTSIVKCKKKAFSAHRGCKLCCKQRTDHRKPVEALDSAAKFKALRNDLMRQTFSNKVQRIAKMRCTTALACFRLLLLQL